MFLGRYYHSLESKGRLAIPPLFRRLLGAKPILTRGLDGCLYLLPTATWKKLIADLHTSPLADRHTRTLTRLLAHDALELQFDPQGRALLSADLRRFAGLTKKIVIAGSLNWVEIWDQARYHTHFNNTASHMDEIAARFREVNHD
ncbi:MAG: division/cell wall cluster transcriptional repressor MraZ [Candidatus Chisholmbacteria bacterium RIFCSPHIGHO2_01_FULL_48_12]|uniref:Transcriptional regulator MraZ n=1 Tax=Candidatus Chisholmbacteria bacterium RIFCSPHIGHO2_01_FULL_48_12 TaxID=1797589 RepID=A0A1G1VJB7_9BACT|nr:MAG: division/cell wall cluster transcriptional repressor MraZ [Candidatus Chisholmbacteria bacterium RIFCSPHIGHO2_01_FULL_48_12]